MFKLKNTIKSHDNNEKLNDLLELFSENYLIDEACAVA